MTVRERAVAEQGGPAQRPPSALVTVLWAVTAVVAGATLLGFASPLGWAADLVAAFRAHYAVVGVVCLAGMAATRRWSGVLVAAAVVAANVAVIAPLWLDTPMPAPAGAPTLTVLWHNVRDPVGEDRVPDLVDAIADADVAVLGRVDWDVVQALDASDALPHVLAYHDVDVGLVVLARVPVTDVRPVGPLPAGSRDTAVAFDAELAPGRSVGVLAMHTLSPRTPRRAAVRDAELAVAASWAGEQAGPAVVVGDLNTPPWSRQLRALARAGGLLDSARGHGLQPTWPAPWGLAGVPIDHALHSPDLAVVGRTTGPGLGSRHRSVTVTVAPTEPAPR